MSTSGKHEEHNHDSDCDCGHDHHEHDEHCDHGEDCDCGHDHHAHAHEHGHSSDDEINITTHDEATVGSINKKIHVSLDAAKNSVSSVLRELGSWADSKGAVIGHIKAFLQSEGDSCSLSLTTDTVQESDFKSNVVQVNVAAILFMVTVDELRDKLGELVKEYL